MKTKTLVFALIAVFAVNTSFAQDARKADHEALRKLLTAAKDAMNNNKLGDLKPMIDSQNFTLIDVTNKQFKSFDEFQKHWEGFFKGDKAMFKKVEVNPEASALTEFLSSNVGVCHGVSKDTYHFTDGDVRKMEVRWTCVVRREAGTWKISKLHFSANLMDNPVVDAAKASLTMVGAGCAGAGLLVGLVLLVLFRKKS